MGLVFTGNPPKFSGPVTAEIPTSTYSGTSSDDANDSINPYTGQGPGDGGAGQTSTQIEVDRAGGPPADEFFSSVSLLLPMDADFDSVDDDTKTGSFSGSPVITTDTKLFGEGSGDFTTNGSYVNFGTHADFGFGTDSFTVECHFRQPGGDNIDGGLMTTAPNGAGVGFFLRQAGVNRLQFLIGAGGGPFNLMSGNTELVVNQWYHGAAVYNAADGKMYLWLDGVEDATALVRTIGATTLDTLHVGDMYVDIGLPASNTSSGYLDNVRITKGVARYLEPFTPPTQEFPTS